MPRRQAGVRLRDLSQSQAAPQVQGFSDNGNEVICHDRQCSTAEALFWESVNAIGVMRAPAIITVYDDGCGISVPNQFQMVKNIFAIIGIQARRLFRGELRAASISISPGWDYPALRSTIEAVAAAPLSHSVSGRYGSHQPQSHSLRKPGAIKS
jgi:hypothetical protein